MKNREVRGMAHGLVDWSAHHLGLHRGHHDQEPHPSEQEPSVTTKLDTIEDHILEAGEKIKDLAEVHLPAIADFIDALSKNPLVTAFSAAIPGDLGDDAMAVLNGLLPILGALGARQGPLTPVPTPAPEPSSTETAPDTPTSAPSGEAAQ
jgi:hypothetical protein